ncbi:hypothetical protein K504DRAFT_467552 [Pleomassaria siparia CBS 279.74]|uniref:Uncharacterized protein n=1 Tax=Pleomassaria siparia CBS 279.74 TaxID=1314801 RepID=A0A6G1K9L3_9PLEO|nr:hypothetical protein K504DRAFT_467552 [Pleomassaria siparia CBS 279.74]
MPYVQINRKSDREHSPYYESDSFYSRPLVRRDSKRQRVNLYDEDEDDDEYDDYPYAAKPVKPSRALTIRQPTQLEKYNVWSYSPSPPTETRSRAHDRYDSDDVPQYKYTHNTSHERYSPRTAMRTYPTDDDDDDEDKREREFRLKIKASFGRPKSALSRSNSFKQSNIYDTTANKAMAWSGDLFKRRDKWEGTKWETRERRGAETRGYWPDDDEETKNRIEKGVRFRQVKRTRTDEWRPLTGFRRA